MNDIEQLQSLDPVRDWHPSPAQRISAEAVLDGLVRERRSSITRRGVLRSAVVVAALAGVVIFAPALLPGGGGQARAYAAWSTPRPVGGVEALALASDCARTWGAGWGRAP